MLFRKKESKVVILALLPSHNHYREKSLCDSWLYVLQVSLLGRQIWVNHFLMNSSYFRPSYQTLLVFLLVVFEKNF